MRINKLVNDSKGKIAKTEMTFNHTSPELHGHSDNKKTLHKIPSFNLGYNAHLMIKKNTSEGMLAVRETSKSPLLKKVEGQLKDHVSMMDYEEN